MCKYRIYRNVTYLKARETVQTVTRIFSSIRVGRKRMKSHTAVTIAPI
jgi:hypothetical protein